MIHNRCTVLIVVLGTYFFRCAGLRLFPISRNIIIKHAAAQSDTTSEPLDIIPGNINDKPVPKVPASAWKWPPAWPFPPDYLSVVPVSETSESSSDARAEAFKFVKSLVSAGSNVLELYVDGSLLLSESPMFNCTFMAMSDVLQSSINYEFDSIVISGGIETIDDPKSFLRRIWRLLKPKGSCFILFSGCLSTSTKFATKMWTNMNVEQKIWIAGSYFRYSVDDGWSSIEGYDVTDKSTTQMVFNTANSSDNVFAVRGEKVDLPLLENGVVDSMAKRVSYTLMGLENIDSIDSSYLSYRLANQLDDMALDSLAVACGAIDSIYSVLKVISDEVLPKPIKAMLASLLLNAWSGSDSQATALRNGLGLDLNGNSFWPRLSQATSKLAAREKLYLLADLVSLWGNTNLIEELPEVITSVTDTLKSRFVDSDEAVLQQLAVDLSITEFLHSSKPKPAERLLKYVSVLDSSVIRDMMASIPRAQ